MQKAKKIVNLVKILLQFASNFCFDLRLYSTQQFTAGWCSFHEWSECSRVCAFARRTYSSLVISRLDFHVLQLVLRSVIFISYYFFYLHRPITTSGARYRRSACIEYQSVIQTSCGSGLLRHGLNFSTAWCTMRLISGQKDWKHVLTQKMVVLNTCCDAACLTFQLPHITTGSFRATDDNPFTS